MLPQPPLLRAKTAHVERAKIFTKTAPYARVKMLTKSAISSPLLPLEKAHVQGLLKHTYENVELK